MAVSVSASVLFAVCVAVSVRPRALFVFNSAGMNPPEKFFVSFLLIVLRLIALLEVLPQLKIFECVRVDCL